MRWLTTGIRAPNRNKEFKAIFFYLVKILLAGILDSERTNLDIHSFDVCFVREMSIAEFECQMSYGRKGKEEEEALIEKRARAYINILSIDNS